MRAFDPKIFVVFVAVLCLGCGGEQEDPRGRRVGVRGTVLLDGNPLDRARIVFRAAEGENKITATGQIVNGAYKIPAESGPLAGKMRVEIQADKIELEEFEAAHAGNIRKRVPVETVVIPARYNSRSILTALVTEEEAQNLFDYRLESKPK